MIESKTTARDVVGCQAHADAGDDRQGAQRHDELPGTYGGAAACGQQPREPAAPRFPTVGQQKRDRAQKVARHEGQPTLFLENRRDPVDEKVPADVDGNGHDDHDPEPTQAHHFAQADGPVRSLELSQAARPQRPEARASPRRYPARRRKVPTRTRTSETDDGQEARTDPNATTRPLATACGRLVPERGRRAGRTSLASSRRSGPCTRDQPDEHPDEAQRPDQEKSGSPAPEVALRASPRAASRRRPRLPRN